MSTKKIHGDFMFYQCFVSRGRKNTGKPCGQDGDYGWFVLDFLLSNIAMEVEMGSIDHTDECKRDKKCVSSVMPDNYCTCDIEGRLLAELAAMTAERR